MLNTNLLHREDWFVGESSRMFLKEGGVGEMRKWGFIGLLLGVGVIG